MSDAVADAPIEPSKSKKLNMILALVLASIGAGGGFYAVSSGMFSSHGNTDDKSGPAQHVEMLPAIAFVEIEPILISLSGGQHVQHLRFRAQLEVAEAYQADVEHILPRIVDVLNSYLRALDLEDLEDPLALTRLRAQMLRRVQVVAGAGRVRDLLIMEFVLN
ncbi:flagellar basal body-associated FliL family protein [Sedimentitalea nanhaiensis]|uniref:Flagellar protein FliL n=1 Tax=Sedimentitalea nanhaiensis TaxID=999627 RepID=A0A1I7C7G5_9RHOB|nr:flagellar basal body-associated FliL family protein [Sedimentitalea nanhaiensis]SFT95376.1 flagellar FliL protein [Sedimentitalea nanhaiensis]